MMMDRWSGRIKIAVDEGSNRVFFYTGVIEDEDEYFIVFNDRKNGKMQILKNRIVKVEEA